jgi:hypothetical protein
MKIKNILLITIIIICTNSCVKVPPENGEGESNGKDITQNNKIIIERKPCKADLACQNDYDKLLEDAYKKIMIDSLRTTESLNQAKQILKKAKLNECGECLDIQKTKWDNIYSKSEEGYKSSESIVKDYNDSDHKLRMEQYKALMEISKNAIQK